MPLGAPCQGWSRRGRPRLRYSCFVHRPRIAGGTGAPARRRQGPRALQFDPASHANMDSQDRQENARKLTTLAGVRFRHSPGPPAPRSQALLLKERVSRWFGAIWPRKKPIAPSASGTAPRFGAVAAGHRRRAGGFGQAVEAAGKSSPGGTGSGTAAAGWRHIPCAAPWSIRRVRTAA